MRRRRRRRQSGLIMAEEEREGRSMQPYGRTVIDATERNNTQRLVNNNNCRCRRLYHASFNLLSDIGRLRSPV